MAKIVSEVPATPRSKVFSYYQNSAAIGGTSGGTVPPAVDPTDGGINVNNLDNNSFVTNIAINPDDPATIDITKKNLTVNTSGTGNVISEVSITNPATVNITKTTINSGITFASAGSGNTVAELSYNTTNNTLTKTKGDCVTRLYAGEGITLNPASGIGGVEVSAAGGNNMFVSFSYNGGVYDHVKIRSGYFYLNGYVGDGFSALAGSIPLVNMGMSTVLSAFCQMNSEGGASSKDIIPWYINSETSLSFYFRTVGSVGDLSGIRLDYLIFGQ
jgi:hypothetical protein